MANQVRRNGVWERAAADLERKGYTVESTENGNGTPVFTITNPVTGKTRETRFPDEITNLAATWPKIKMAAAGSEKAGIGEEGATQQLHKKSAQVGTNPELELDPVF